MCSLFSSSPIDYFNSRSFFALLKYVAEDDACVWSVKAYTVMSFIWTIGRGVRGYLGFGPLCCFG
jgi:hypothetical protein